VYTILLRRQPFAQEAPPCTRNRKVEATPKKFMGDGLPVLRVHRPRTGVMLWLNDGGPHARGNSLRDELGSCAVLTHGHTTEKKKTIPTTGLTPRRSHLHLNPPPVLEGYAFSYEMSEKKQRPLQTKMSDP